ncbi:hypothetical protein D6783_05465, partial [Candidatus Woesearchaeota archaeon]
MQRGVVVPVGPKGQSRVVMLSGVGGLIVLFLLSVYVLALAQVTIHTPAENSTNQGSFLLNASTDAQASNVTFFFINASGVVVDNVTNTTPGTTFLFSYNATERGLPDGVYNITANATNTSGTTVSATNANVTIDATPPVVGDPAPLAGTLYNESEQVVLEVNASDALVGVEAVEASVSLPNASVSTITLSDTNSDGRFNGTFSDTSLLGRYNVTFIANDTVGNVNDSVTTWFNVSDGTPPSVSSPTVTPSLARSSDPVEINVTVTDTQGVAGVNVSNASSVVMANVSATLWTVVTNATALGCGEGVCTLTFTAVDNYGNVNNSVTASLTVDDTPPLQAENLTNQSTGRTWVFLAWNVSNATDVNHTEVWRDGSVFVANTSQTSYNVTGLVAATAYTFQVYTVDDAGNKNTSVSAENNISVTTNPPNQLPAVVQINLTPLSPLVNEDLNCSFVVEDNNTGQSLSVNITWFVDGSSFLNTSFGVSNGTLASHVLGSGNTSVGEVWTCEVRPFDGEAYGSAVNASNVTILDTPLLVSLTAPSNNSQHNATFLLNATTNEVAQNATFFFFNTSGDLVVNVTNTTSGTVFTYNFNATQEGLPDGVYNITVNATKSTGTVGSDTGVNITVDTTSPTISSVSLSDNITKNNTNVSVTVNVSDALVGVVSVSAEGVSLVSVGGGLWNGTITLVAGGSPVDVIATDGVGNVQTDTSAGFIIDDTAPTIHSVSLSDNITKNNTNVSVTVNVSDATGVVSVSAEGVGLVSVGGGLWNGTIALVAGGSPVDVVAVDEADNNATDTSATFTIDDINPSAQNASVNASLVQNTTPIRLNITASDNTGVAAVTAQNTSSVSLNLVNGSLYSAVTNASALGCPEGQCVIAFIVTDEADNTNASTTLTITNDNTPATISNVTNSSITNESAVVQWQTNENTTGVVWYGTSSGNYTFSVANNSIGVQHAVTIVNLSPNTTYFYVVNTTDVAGNKNQSGEFNFTTEASNDTAVPAVSAVTATPSTVEQFSPVEIAANVSDNVAVDTVLANISWPNGTSETITLLDGDADGRYNASYANTFVLGVHNVTIIANDTSGNRNDSETTTYTVVDTVPPSVSGGVVNDSVVHANASIRINVTVDDNNTVASVVVGNSSTVSMSNVSATLWTVVTNATALGCGEGTCFLRFNATDASSNSNTSEGVSILVDSVSPVIVSVSLSDNVTRNNTNVSVTVNV